jgi:hypothetical protein
MGCPDDLAKEGDRLDDLNIRDCMKREKVDED